MGYGLRETIKPTRLRPGDTIGVIAPASPTKPDVLKKALAVFSAFDFPVKIGQSVMEQAGYLAGDDTVRLHDLHQMFGDDEVKAVFCMSGGYGTLRIVEQVDYGWIRTHPKPFVGYSDITALHIAIQQRTGMLTFHGPMISNLAHDAPDLYSWEVLFHLLSGPLAKERYMHTRDDFGMDALSHTLRGGTVEGQLTGGNLSLLASTLGTPFELQTEGRILFIEEVNEKPYCIDRMLTQLRLAGKLQSALGIVFTDFKKCVSQEEGQWDVLDVIRDRMQGILVPAFFGLPAGHCFPNLTLPIGGKVRINATDRILEVVEGCVM